MTAGPVIDYEALTQEAMRGLVRTVLSRIVKSGLPGDHHFYIAFDTRAPGVALSRRLKEKYPDEMTIVLQHRFWDLAVTDERFEVKLTFDGIPERLVVPFASLKVFFDPSVRYTLQFDDMATAEEPLEGGPRRRENGATRRAGALPGGEAAPDRAGPRPLAERRPRSRAKPRADKTGATEPAPAPMPVLVPREDEPPKRDEAPGDAAAAPTKAGAQVVSLDSFRRK